MKSWAQRSIQNPSKLFLLLAITSIGLVLRLYNLGSQSLWFDETYTVFVARLPLIEGWRFLVADGVHPPLFYWIEKIFLHIGSSEFVVRLPALIFGVLAIPALYLLGKNWLPENQALLASLLLALSPYHIWYSQEARMYSALVWLAILMMGLFYANIAMPGRGKRIAFILLSSIAYLVHYYALILPLIQFAHLLTIFRRNPRVVREWTAMQALAALPLMGWLLVLSQRDGQYFGIGWIPETQWEDLLLTMINFTVGISNQLTTLHWLAGSAVLMIILRALLMRWSTPVAKAFICLWAFLPPLLIYLLSFRRPLYVDRFLIFCLPPILILIAQGMSKLEVKLALAARLLIIALFLLGWYSLNLSPDRAIKENWREAIAYLDTQAGEDELVVQRILQIAVPMKYYSNGNLDAKALEVNRQVDSLDELAAGYPGVWLIYWNASADTHSVAQKVGFDPLAEKDITAASWIKGEGPALSHQVDYPGITIFHFTDFHLTR